MSFEWANEASRTFMSRGYLHDGESVEERCRALATHAETVLGIDGYAQKLYDYLSRGWFSLASPVWSNFGRSGLPISCNNSYIPDSIAGILTKQSEVGMMTKHGAGTSGYFGDIRPRGTTISSGGYADGPVHFMNLFETQVDIISQGNVRRGNFAAYLPVDHPDILEFLEIREEGNPIQKLFPGVTITDDWITEMNAGDVVKQKIMARIIEKRFATGLPYIIFHDTVNRNAPDVYRDNNMIINGSNLCTEIFLPSTFDESYVCDLSSMNLLFFDDWKDTDAVEILVFLLDAVMSEYIFKTANIPHMEAAHRFAVNHRAIGIGTLGLHSLYQSKMIPFESFEAKALNSLVHKTVAKQALKASQELGEMLGVPELLEPYCRRNATVMAIAPTTSSSFILGQVSPSIEPLHSNYFTKNLAKGKFTYRNPFLQQIIGDDEVIWQSILSRGGSVQHLDVLSEHEKLVFKTFGEISQLEIIQQAGARQKFIDQGQSINLMIHPKTPGRDVKDLILEAWRLGVKSLYYQKGQNMSQELVRDILSCTSCEA